MFELYIGIAIGFACFGLLVALFSLIFNSIENGHEGWRFNFRWFGVITILGIVVAILWPLVVAIFAIAVVVGVPVIAIVYGLQGIVQLFKNGKVSA